MRLNENCGYSCSTHKYSNKGLNNRENGDFCESNHNDRYETIILTSSVPDYCYSIEGAEKTKDVLSSQTLEDADFLFKSEKRVRADEPINGILKEISKISKSTRSDLNDYGSTASFVLVDKEKKKTMTFNIGNNIIFGIKNGELELLSKPIEDDGHVLVTTDEKMYDKADTNIYNELFNSVIIFSDGAWKEMIDGEKLNPNVEKMLIDENYDGVEIFLRSRFPADDNSYIAFNCKEIEKSKSDERVKVKNLEEPEKSDESGKSQIYNLQEIYKIEKERKEKNRKHEDDEREH